MRCASISVGIVDYEDAHYRSSSMKLEFATDDANAFHQYASTAWDGENDIHLFLHERGARKPDVVSAFETLSTNGKFDLLIVYMSGHGEIEESGAGWFCLADTAAGTPGLTGDLLNALLMRVNAERVLLFLDCCHAEAVAAGMSFFSALNGQTTRMFVGSARAGQRAWEDKALRRSIFSDALLRSLSTDSTVANWTGKVDLEAGLLPWLRHQVPLSAIALKNGENQTPVFGGTSIAATLLPLVTSKSLGRELTVAQTVRRRMRRFAGVTAACLIVSLLLLDTMAYHVAVSGTGNIVVRPGLEWSYGLMPVHVQPVVDTGLKLDDIDPGQDEFIAKLSSGSIFGITTHLDARRLRPWLSDIEGFLKSEARSSFLGLAAGEEIRLDPRDHSPPIDVAGFLSTLGEPIDTVAAKIYPLDDRVTLACSAPVERHVDFSILSSSRETFAKDAGWYAATAPSDLALRVSRAEFLMKLAAYRASHEESRETHAGEFRAYARAIWALYRESSAPAEFARHFRRRLKPLTTGWCAAHAKLALALVGDTDERPRWEAELLGRLGDAFGDQGGFNWSGDQHFAYLSLLELGRRGLLTAAAVEPAVQAIEQDIGQLGADTPAPALIKAISPEGRLPPRLISKLLTTMHAQRGDFDFAPLSAFAVLSANVKFLDQGARGDLLAWAAKHAAENSTMSDFHRGLGYLAFYGAVTESNLDILIARMSAASRFPPSATNYRGEMVIRAGGDDALVALGRVAQVTPLPAELIERLSNIAMGRPQIEDRSAILLGLAEQWYGGLDKRDLPQKIVNRVSAAQGLSDRRHLEVEVISANLAQQDAETRKEALVSLIEAWRHISEPEIKASLALVISRVALPPD